jgi:murein DD-endopeptidase MepM/ murein hydrolase activator NlpD
MDARDWQARLTSRSGALGGAAPSPRPGQPGQMGTSARPATTPVPLIPRFEWSPGQADFPLPFPGSEPPAVVSIYPDVFEPRQAAPEALEPAAPLPFPFPIRSVPLLAALLVLGALVVFAAWQFLGDEEEEPGIGAIATQAARATATSGSILATPTGVVAQTPGAGGAEPGATPTPAEPGTPGAPAVTPEPATPDTGTTPDTGEEPVTPESAGTAEPDLASGGALLIETFEGENLFDVAERWGLSVSSLIWANDIGDPGEVLEAGTELIIPRYDGIIYTVQPGDTLESIAAQFDGVYSWDIVNIIQNEVRSDADLYPGQLLTIPGAHPFSRASVAWYTVRPGDDVFKIAGYYGLQGATIAFANDLPSTLLIHPDQELVIPPADGLLVVAHAGDTVESIAARFEVSPDVIRSFPFNELMGTAQPREGQWVHIPSLEPIIQAGGKGGAETTPVADPFRVATPESAPPAQAVGWFMWPTWGNLTQHFHPGHNGLDIANAAWTPIVAADGGVVTFSGWNEYGLGYAVAIDHENGYVTWYGHFAEVPAVSVGDRVAQGTWLGPMGSTGKSTGPHLHFIIIRDGVYQDPADYLP